MISFAIADPVRFFFKAAVYHLCPASFNKQKHKVNDFSDFPNNSPPTKPIVPPQNHIIG